MIAELMSIRIRILTISNEPTFLRPHTPSYLLQPSLPPATLPPSNPPPPLPPYMAQARCQETRELLRSRQAVLTKARRQMKFDCQSFVDLGEVLGEDVAPWGSRRRSVSSIGSRRELSRCSSIETDDDSGE